MEEVKKYISTRYQRYLDYADYHSSLAGLDQQGSDVLHEVIISVLEKDEQMVIDLYNAVKKQYRELDFYILRMVKLNCHSKTSPYRWRYRQPDLDDNLITSEIQELEQKVEQPEINRDELTCSRYEVIREVLDSMDHYTEAEKEIFRWKFFHGNTWRQYQGDVSKDNLQKIYKAILRDVIYRVEMRKRAYTGHIVASRQRMEDIMSRYRKSLFPGAYRYSDKYRRAEKVMQKYSEKLKSITGKSQGPCLET